MLSEKTDSTFGYRLLKALEYQGFTDHRQQIEMVAKACTVTPRTARKWLQSDKYPIRMSGEALIALADSLDADDRWLFDGNGISPKLLRLLKCFRTMTDWEQGKFMRYLLRLKNKDAKAIRLGDMCVAGKISGQQLLGMM